jgi:hypothetical protein
MKKNKTQSFLKATVVIAVAVGVILPGTTISANIGLPATIDTSITFLNENNIMGMENKYVTPGDTEVFITVFGTWSMELGGYELAFYYDKTKIEFVDINFQATVAKGLPWTSYWWANETPTPAYVVGVAVTFSPEPEDLIPPGSGSLFTVIANIKTTASYGETLLDLDQMIGPIPSYCSYSDVLGAVTFPDELIDGLLTIGPKCADVNFDGIVNVGDLEYLITYLFRGGAEPMPLICVGDLTRDGIVNVADVVFLINFKYRGGPKPEYCCTFA